MNDPSYPIMVRSDFNGLVGDYLCLSHGEARFDEQGVPVLLHAGMLVTAFEEDYDEEGRRDDLIATGIVEESPPFLNCVGSKWALRIDGNGVRHASDAWENK